MWVVLAIRNRIICNVCIGTTIPANLLIHKLAIEAVHVESETRTTARYWQVRVDQLEMRVSV
jgi:hypothetical protein